MEEEASERQAGASAGCVGLEGGGMVESGRDSFQPHSAPGSQLGSTSALRQGYLSSVSSASEWPKMDAIDCHSLNFVMCLLIHMTRNMGKQQKYFLSFSFFQDRVFL